MTEKELRLRINSLTYIYTFTNYEVLKKIVDLCNECYECLFGNATNRHYILDANNDIVFPSVYHNHKTPITNIDILYNKRGMYWEIQITCMGSLIRRAWLKDDRPTIETLRITKKED